MERWKLFAMDITGLSLFTIVSMLAIVFGYGSTAGKLAIVCLALCAVAFCLSLVHGIDEADGSPSALVFGLLVFTILLAAVFGFASLLAVLS